MKQLKHYNSILKIKKIIIQNFNHLQNLFQQYPLLIIKSKKF